MTNKQRKGILKVCVLTTKLKFNCIFIFVTGTITTTINHLYINEPSKSQQPPQPLVPSHQHSRIRTCCQSRKQQQQSAHPPSCSSCFECPYISLQLLIVLCTGMRSSFEANVLCWSMRCARNLGTMIQHSFLYIPFSSVMVLLPPLISPTNLCFACRIIGTTITTIKTTTINS